MENACSPLISYEMEGEKEEIKIEIGGTGIVSQQDNRNNAIEGTIKSSFLSNLHAGYFRITLSLSCQALLWKTLTHPSPTTETHCLTRFLQRLPSTAFILLWSVSLFSLLSLSLLYCLRSFFQFHRLKTEFLDRVRVNYLFVPWISSFLLLQSSPFFSPNTVSYAVLWWVTATPVLILDLKIYGQWFTKGKRFLSKMANPASHLSVIANFAAARGAAEMGWKESAVFLFSLGMAHYLVLFVTLYQRFQCGENIPCRLRPVFFLFFAAPSIAALSWSSISGSFDTPSKMFFFLSLFLFSSLVARPNFFKKSMRRFDVAWWAYSFPLTVLALASIGYAEEVKDAAAHGLTLVLSVLSMVLTLGLMVFTALNTNFILNNVDGIGLSS